MAESIEVTLLFKGQTPKAYLVEDDGEEIWLPRSQVEIESGARIDTKCGFIIPEWLAEEKGLT